MENLKALLDSILAHIAQIAEPAPSFQNVDQNLREFSAKTGETLAAIHGELAQDEAAIVDIQQRLAAAEKNVSDLANLLDSLVKKLIGGDASQPVATPPVEPANTPITPAGPAPVATPTAA